MEKELTLPIPQTHPGELIGREEDLEQLHEFLTEQKRVVIVNGLGGIGKTTLVQAYVYSYYEAYDHIAWITHGSDHDFASIIRQLQDVADRRNLLIIDHGEATLQQYRNVFPQKTHVLVTARETIMGFFPQALGFLSEDQALTLFRKFYLTGPHAPEQLPGQEQDIRKLVKAVDYHTLTIELLARTAAIHQLEPSILEKIIRADEHSSTRLIDRVDTYLQSVLSLSKLTGQEIALLKQLSCLPAQYHPQILLRDLLEDHDQVMLTETLTAVVRKGWLVQNLLSDSYKMHPIVASVVRKNYPVAFTDVADLVEVINGWLRVDDNDDPADHFMWIPYGKALLACFPDETFQEIAMLQNHLALRLKDQGDIETAKTLLEKAVRTHELLFGGDHLSTAISYFNLALVLQELGEKARAIPLLENTLRVFQTTLPEDHPYMLQARAHYLAITNQ